MHQPCFPHNGNQPVMQNNTNNTFHPLQWAHGLFLSLIAIDMQPRLPPQGRVHRKVNHSPCQNQCTGLAQHSREKISCMCNQNPWSFRPIGHILTLLFQNQWHNIILVGWLRSPPVCIRTAYEQEREANHQSVSRIPTSKVFFAT